MSSKTRLVSVIAFAFLSAGCGSGPSRVTGATPGTPQRVSSAKGQAPSDAAAAPAAFNTFATTRPAAISANSADIADAFDSQLQRLINADSSSDPSLSSLPADEKDLLTTVVDSLSSFRTALRNGDGLMATRVAPLLALSDRIKSQTPLALPTLTLCSKVTQFGVYDAIEPTHFAAGKDTQTLVYCEVDNFTSVQQSDGRFETKLSYESVLYGDNEHSTAAVLAKKPARIVDTCRNRRRDFFLADRMTIPATLPSGKYILKVTVVDELANHVAERIMPITIAPN